MKKRLYVIVAGCVCSTSLVAGGLRAKDDLNVERPRTVQSRCTVPEGWTVVAARGPRFVVFGELHGTQEAPAFVGEAACSLVSRGEKILVAIEHNVANDPALQSAWRLSPDQFPAALEKIGWEGLDDGRGSAAMFDLLVDLHRLSAQGRSIHVTAFAGSRGEAQRQRFRDASGQDLAEAEYADNLRVAADARAYDRVLVLVGNLHARKRPVERGGVSYKPLAMRLEATAPMVTLNMQTAPGTMWGCFLAQGFRFEPGKPMPADAIKCDRQPVKGDAHLNRPSFISLTTPPSGEHPDDYDGFFWLGPVTASPPHRR